MVSNSNMTLKLSLASTDMQLRILGIISAIPLSVLLTGDRELFVLHLFVFLPLSGLYIARNGVHWSTLTTIDRLVLAYLFWAMLSFGLNLIRSVLQGADSALEPRLFSVGALAINFVAPFLIGRVIFATEHDMRAFVDGLLLGAAISVAVYLGDYAYLFFFDPANAEYLFGRRVPMVLGFLIAIYIFYAKSSLLVYSSVIFFFSLLIWLSGARAAVLSLLIILLLSGTMFWKEIGTRKLASIGLAVTCAFFVSLMVNKTTINRLETTIEMGLQDESSNMRLILQDESSNMRLMMWTNLLSHAGQDIFTIVFGFGQLGPGYIGDRMVSPQGLVMERYSAHNEYLDQVIRGGVVYLAIYVLILGYVVYYGVRISRISPMIGPAYLGMSVGLIGVFVYAFFYESTRYPWFGILFWVLVGGLSNCWQRKNR